MQTRPVNDLHDLRALEDAQLSSYAWIDRQAGTLTLEGANESFVVRCADLCDSFTAGDKSPMLYRGAVMVYRKEGKTYRFPILKQHVNFDVTGGRG